MKQNRENPFFETYRTPFGTPPFDQIETEQYEPVFDEGIRQLDEEVRAIADNTELPTFENTIIALERSGKLLDKVISAFHFHTLYTHRIEAASCWIKSSRLSSTY